MSLTLLQAETEVRALTRHDSDTVRVTQTLIRVWLHHEYRALRTWLQDVAPELYNTVSGAITLAEAASELRRSILDALRRNDMAPCEQWMDTMDDVYSLLVTMDFPEAITGGLRRTTDQLRGVLERTRGDLTMAMICQRTGRAAHSIRRILASMAGIESRQSESVGMRRE